MECDFVGMLCIKQIRRHSRRNVRSQKRSELLKREDIYISFLRVSQVIALRHIIHCIIMHCVCGELYDITAIHINE